MEKEVVLCIFFTLVILALILAALWASGTHPVNVEGTNKTLESAENSESNVSDANMVAIPGKPKIWYCNRVLIVERADAKVPLPVLEAFLSPDANLSALGVPVDPIPVEYSCRSDVGRCFYEGKVCFSHAVKGDGWRVQWGMYYCGTEKPVEATCVRPASCAVYFTGIGCPHCALTDPWLFYEFVPKHPVVVVEYEIYRDASANGPIMDEYVRKYGEYGAVPGVPQIIFDENHIVVGDMPIVKELNKTVSEVSGCILPWLEEMKE